MPKILTLQLLAVLLAFAFSVHALAQPGDGTANYTYTPTGDELFDTYSGELLQYYLKVDPAAQVTGFGFLMVPHEVLLGMEDRFGDDPRYWQLLYWDAFSRNILEDRGYIDPDVYLQQGIDRGAFDNVTLMLHFDREMQDLKKAYADYCERDIPLEQLLGPVEPGLDNGLTWCYERQSVLADKLVMDCPTESWPWFKRAMLRFEYGEWELGLEDLTHSNQARSNRVPVPFPVSFLQDRIADGQPCGNEIIAGMILQKTPETIPPSMLILLKERIKEQEVRLSLGMPLAELEPWHNFICRLGAMDGGDSTQWLSAMVMHNMVVKLMLVDSPESFTRRQRESLWRLELSGTRIRDLFNKASMEADAAQSRLDEVFESYGLNPIDLADNTILQQQVIDEIEVGQDIFDAYFLSVFAEKLAIHGPIKHMVKERFASLTEFDFGTYSFPDGEHD